jgi:hypothetical protein
LIIPNVTKEQAALDPSRFDHISKMFADRRLSRRKAMQGAGALAAGAVVTAGMSRAAAALDATPMASPEANAEHPSFMFVQTFGEGSITDAGNGNLTLTADHLTGQTIFFSDRPERIVGTVPTQKFLGLDNAPTAATTLGSGAATPEGGPGVTPSNPPNAALVFNSAEGSDEPGDVIVVELINPTYDPGSKQATYEIKVLADDTAVDMSFVSEPVAMADAIRAFEGASLFIDDCASGDIVCVNETTGARTTIVSADDPTGYCWDSGLLCCTPCAGISYWTGQCYQLDHTCGGGNTCYATYDWQVFYCPDPGPDGGPS